MREPPSPDERLTARQRRIERAVAAFRKRFCGERGAMHAAAARIYADLAAEQGRVMQAIADAKKEARHWRAQSSKRAAKADSIVQDERRKAAEARRAAEDAAKQAKTALLRHRYQMDQERAAIAKEREIATAARREAQAEYRRLVTKGLGHPNRRRGEAEHFSVPQRPYGPQPRELRVLWRLLRSEGRVVLHEDLATAIAGDAEDGGPMSALSMVKMAASVLNHALAPLNGMKRTIISYRGLGYQIVRGTTIPLEWQPPQETQHDA